jgi:hypothetical protein
MRQLYVCENNVYNKRIAPILLMIIIRVILISLGLHLEALAKRIRKIYSNYNLGSPFIHQGVLFYKISIMLIE